MILEKYKNENDLYICECGREFCSGQSLKSHFRFCKIHKSQKEKKVSKYKISDGLYRCECGMEFNNHQSLNAHFSYCELHHNFLNKEIKTRNYIKNHTMNGWEKFSKKEINEFHKKSSTTLKERYDSGEIVSFWCNNNIDTTESHKKLSESISKLRENGKTYCRGSMGYYNGIHCDSSWELAYLIYSIEHNIEIKRCNKRFIYIFNNEQHIYTPDFIINNCEIIEIKGFKDERWEEKKKCCLENNIKIIDKEGIKPYLKYVKNKYGKNFIDLYNK